MPVIGIVSETVTDLAAGKVRVTGVLAGLDTSSWAVRDELYASETTAGALQNTRPVTAATDEIQIVATVARSHPSAGTVAVAHAGRSNALPQLSEGQIWVGDSSGLPVEIEDPTAAASRNSKTGLDTLPAGLLVINGGDNTKIDIAAGNGHVLDFTVTPATPTDVELTWTAFLAVTLPDIGTTEFTSVFIEDTGGGVPGVVLTDHTPTPAERREMIYLGFAIHFDNLVVNDVSIEPIYGIDSGGTVDDLMEALGDFNIFGNEYGANSGANLLMDRTAGRVFSRAITADLSSPNFKLTPANVAIGLYAYNNRDGSGGWDTVPLTAVDPNFYDDGSGTLAAVSSNDFTIQPIIFAPSTELDVLEYGQAVYNTMADAIEGIALDGVETNPSFRSSILRGWLVVRQGTTDLTASADAIILTATGFNSQASGVGTDPEAIHVNIPGEINGIANKAVPVSADVFVGENSASSFAKFHSTFAQLVETPISTHDAASGAHTGFGKLDGSRAWTGTQAFAAITASTATIDTGPLIVRDAVGLPYVELTTVAQSAADRNRWVMRAFGTGGLPLLLFEAWTDGGGATAWMSVERGAAAATKVNMLVPMATDDLDLGTSKLAVNDLRIRGTDPTKEAIWDVNSVTTSTVRTLTVPDRNINLGGFLSVMTFGADTIDTTTTVRYMNPPALSQYGDIGTTELVMVVPYAGTVSRLYVRQNTPGTGIETTTYTVRQNAGDTTLLIGLVATATQASDLVNTFTVATGDRIAIKVTKSGALTTSPVGVTASMQLQAD